MSPSKQLRIFVVDDEDVIASSLAMILRFQGGFHATSFTDPLKALQAVHAEVPDLLITDVVMPQMSGIDLAIQLSDICPDCKVLLFSGQAATADLLEAARSSGYKFELLLKPVHPADLLASIRALTGGAQPENRVPIGIMYGPSTITPAPSRASHPPIRNIYALANTPRFSEPVLPRQRSQ
jgi:DNA-binding NtrC family response regulator